MAEYVTVVSVDVQPQITMTNVMIIEPEIKSPFVTVLSINNNQTSTTVSTLESPKEGEIVTVYRLAGERLGFGLKFQGGTKTNEKIQRLFIQSCDPDSPASKARASWGPLSEGDEVLEIDNMPVTKMTRIECVKCLKDRNVAINLRVVKQDNLRLKNGVDASAPKKRMLPPPPPTVPPRKIIKKPVARELIVAPKIVAIEIPTPVVAELYLNTLDDEINLNDESDETGSTISSQISVISNFSTESDLPIMSRSASSNDLAKILTKPFQMIELEFNVNSTAVIPSATPMSIDNLLMLNESERIEAKDEPKPLNAYENVNVGADLLRQNESNNNTKLPIPRPRSISLPNPSSEIDAKTPSTTIESWLNDANTLIGSDDKHKTSTDEHEQNYESIKFECFAAGDDEDDEKLGPPELINISEAYFNFPWCTNSSGNLPTIGEAEEEFSSLEPNGVYKVAKRPIFIVNTVHDNNECDNESDSNQICHSVDNEINNNHSLSLHECEDEADKVDNRMRFENVSLSVTTATKSLSLERELQNSFNEVIQQKTMANETTIFVATKEIDESLVESSGKVLMKVEATNENDKEMITSDIERLDKLCYENGESNNNAEITSPTLINVLTAEAPQLNEKPTTESKDMTSLPTPNIHQFTSEIQLEQMDRKETENSRMPPDGHEFPVRKLPNGVVARQTRSDIAESIKSPPVPTTKATAIVAPLVPRQAHHFDEISNFVDTKPPFKSATLGRQRPINWRNKDEKSEKSVKDKIAMFSNSTSNISYMIPKTQTKSKSNISNRNGSITKSTENISSSSFKPKGSFKKKAMSVENLDDYEESNVCEFEMKYKPVSKPASLQSPARPLSMNAYKAQSVDNLSVQCDSPMLPRTPPPNVLPSLSRRISFSGYSNSQIEKNQQKSLANILDNRKKSMSKLRGLVIPEKVSESDHEQKVFDLPVIRSKECKLINDKNLFSRSVSMPQSINVTPAKKTFEVQSQLRSAPRQFVADFQAIKSPPIKPPRTSLIIPSSKDRSITTDESDTESCLSSRISSPPVSPVAKKPLARTFSSETNTSISSNSTLTSGSGSQASCSSNGSKTDKPTETISSRKSILASSKSRSGRDCLENSYQKQKVDAGKRKPWRDEDSTDGGIDEDNRRRVPKAKARNSMVNYKVVSPNDNLVDKMINIVTYVEVMSSDTDEKPEAPRIVSGSPAEKNISTKKESPQLNLMSDMAKWVRNEAKSTTENFKSAEKRNSAEIRTTPKSMEPPKKLNLSEIRKNFEIKSTPVSPAPKTPKEKPVTEHNRFSSWDSIASSSSGFSSELLGTGTGTNNSESFQTFQSDFGSFSSFGSSHSLITPQDLQLIIDEADPPLENPEAFVVVLQRETPESSIGITLAGGSDYEAKEITIHRILTNSPADKDGRLKRGNRILSINGLSMRGLTHRESLSVLKSPRSDVVMVVTRSKSIIQVNAITKTKRGSLGSLTSLTEKNNSLEIDEKPLQASKSLETDLNAISSKVENIDSISIVKDSAGLGFSIDGGYDSPNGNKPLTIKKIFMGGSAQRTSNLKVGDEIIKINGESTAKRSRIDVWNMIKMLPMGDSVQLTIKRK